MCIGRAWEETLAEPGWWHVPDDRVRTQCLYPGRRLARIDREEDKAAQAALIPSAFYLVARGRPTISEPCTSLKHAGFGRAEPFPSLRLAGLVWCNAIESTPYMDRDSRERSCRGGFGNFEVLIQTCVV